MDDITHVLCYKDENAAKIKASEFALSGYNVVQVLKTDLVLCDDLVTSPKAFSSNNEFDWIVVIATKSDVVAKGNGITLVPSE